METAKRDRNRVAFATRRTWCTSKQAFSAKPNISVARNAILTDASMQHYVLLRDVICRERAAFHWIEERVRAPSSIGEPDLFYMPRPRQSSKHTSLVQPCETLWKLLQYQVPFARTFRQTIRANNSALSSMYLGANLTIASFKNRLNVPTARHPIPAYGCASPRGRPYKEVCPALHFRQHLGTC